MIRNLAALSLLVGLTSPVAAWAQSPSDSATPPHAWVSIGVGGASSIKGPIGVREAASIAFNHLMVTYSLTAAGSPDGSVGSHNILIGAQAPVTNGFAFISAGLARTGCSPGCAGQSGYAIEGGTHFGGRFAGVGLVAFVTVAPHQAGFGGAVIALDLGWFGR